MPSTLACFRILGYLASIGLHWGNILSMTRVNFDSFDQNVRTFGSLQFRYLTCWTFFLQSAHAVLGLICEYLIIKNKKNYRLPKHLRGARDTLFSAIIFPSTFLVATVFWTLFLYDRNLILPAFVDQVLTPTSNHIMHTMIIPLTLWEVAFQPRSKPKSHKRNVAHLIFHMLLYTSVLLYTYYEKGIWIYPIFGMVYGTIYFYVLILGFALIAFFYYCLQWKLVQLIWGTRKISKNNKIQ